MRRIDQFYVNGAWTAPRGSETAPVVNPATETAFAELALGNAADVDDAVAAARAAFPAFSQTSRQERIDYLATIAAAYQARFADLAAAVTEEMGAPKTLAMQAQAGSAFAHFQTAIAYLEDYPFTETRDGFELIKEPIGVVGLITPWNWPLNQIACKVAPAIAAGCTMVLKPSEIAPASAQILAEAIDAADLPPGVFNMVHGTGPEVGAAIAAHPDIDMVSFTGSTRAGVEVAKNAAPSVKRVAQELGGKSANVILPDADLEKAVRHGVVAVMTNSGQSCNAPTRMLVPADRIEEVAAIAKAAAEAVVVGDPNEDGTTIGPVANATQWNKIQGLLEKGVEEGATLVTGGPGRPVGLETGYYVQPTIFSNVANDMTIAREEIFGPVLSIIPYQDEDDAVAIANDTPYGLAGYVYGGDAERANAVARRLRAGQIQVNGARVNFQAPFGGYKQSGNGREWGAHGLEEFLEVKAVLSPA
ncbi:MAG: aldehyde dehydrogenase family protein [Pseudomonadota bacterium]